MSYFENEITKDEFYIWIQKVIGDKIDFFFLATCDTLEFYNRTILNILTNGTLDQQLRIALAFYSGVRLTCTQTNETLKVPKNILESIKMMEKLADQNHILSWFALGLHQPTLRTCKYGGIQCLEKACELGCLHARVILGDRYWKRGSSIKALSSLRGELPDCCSSGMGFIHASDLAFLYEEKCHCNRLLFNKLLDPYIIPVLGDLVSCYVIDFLF